MRITRSHIAHAGGILLCCCFLATAFEIALVPTGSMERTVLVGDQVLVFKLFDAPNLPGTSLRLPRLHSPRRGTLVSFRAPGQGGAVYLKRVVAVAGDTVEMRGGALYVNGVGEIDGVRTVHMPDLAARKLRAGELFVLGDNRDHSEDSRDFGPITTDSVVGTPAMVLWSTRARSSDLLDARGNLRLDYYWNMVRHPLAVTRWARLGKLL